MSDQDRDAYRKEEERGPGKQPYQSRYPEDDGEPVEDRKRRRGEEQLARQDRRDRPNEQLWLNEGRVLG